MPDFWNLLTANKDLLWAGIVSAIIAAAVSYWFKRRETRHTAQVAYEYEQRKRLRELIGRYHGRLLNAANSMSHRMWNLYTNYDKGWLTVHGGYANPDAYYFQSTVYRFLNVCALLRQLEAEAVLLDARIAEKQDFTFLNYAAALQWVMTDVALTKGLPYDNFDETDHFFSDRFRQACDLCLSDARFISHEKFSALLKPAPELEALLKYFDGLTRNEDRLRWDRLVAFHLLLMAFINSFGYKRQRSSHHQFAQVAKYIRNREVLENLVAWLPRHDLGSDQEAKTIMRAAKICAVDQSQRVSVKAHDAQPPVAADTPQAARR